MKWYKGKYFITDDKKSIDLVATKKMLNSTHWAKERDLATIKKTIENSLCFSLFHNGRQIGFGRVISDFTTYAMFFDIIIEESSRAKGLGSWLFETMTNHPSIKGLKQVLWTSYAEGLYRKHGFRSVQENPIVMFKNYPLPQGSLTRRSTRLRNKRRARKRRILS
jgi:N-acetylglutamate synthase-like GNAT family acetyltransferase